MSKRPWIIAHRGFRARFTENTLPAIRAALRLGVDFVEVDVHETRDGEIVVFHDYRLDRICGVRARLRDKTLAELRRLRPVIPTLAQVLRACRGRARVLIEIKRADPRRVAALVTQLRMERAVIVFTFSLPRLKQFIAANPRIECFGLVARDLRATMPASIAGVGLSRRLVTSSAVVQRLHRRGWKVFVWTVNRPAEMQRLAAWGVDGLITNHPDRALQL